MRAGVGLRQPHHAAFFEAAEPPGFVEVHSENFFAEGGAAPALLARVRERCPVSLHGVGLGLGSAVGLDPWHLDRLAALVRRIDPVRVSDHAAFARAAPRPGAAVQHAHDLLPVACTEAALAIMAANVMQVQARLGRRLLVENLSAYIAYADDTLTEPEFLAALCRRTGCGLLLDLNNLMVNAVNTAAPDPLAACLAHLEALPREVVGEIHLAGYRDTGAIAIDDHGSRVRPAVWTLYEHALRRYGPVPTLVEWDTDLPAWAVLVGEAAQADAIAARVLACPTT